MSKPRCLNAREGWSLKISNIHSLRLPHELSTTSAWACVVALIVLISQNLHLTGFVDAPSEPLILVPEHDAIEWVISKLGCNKSLIFLHSEGIA